MQVRGYEALAVKREALQVRSGQARKAHHAVGR